MVKSPEEWKWSSYKGTSGLEKPHSCLATDWILGQFGGKLRVARKRYMEFVKAGMEEKSNLDKGERADFIW